MTKLEPIEPLRFLSSWLDLRLARLELVEIYAVQPTLGIYIP